MHPHDNLKMAATGQRVARQATGCCMKCHLWLAVLPVAIFVSSLKRSGPGVEYKGRGEVHDGCSTLSRGRSTCRAMSLPRRADIAPRRPQPCTCCALRHSPYRRQGAASRARQPDAVLAAHEGAGAGAGRVLGACSASYRKGETTQAEPDTAAG